MGDTVLRVENLGKQYRLGRRERYRTLRDTMADLARRPLRWLRRATARGGRAGGERDAETIWALRDVGFEVRRGEVVGVIGRNGAGKSTLLKVLSRITEPTTGEVDICGRVGSLLEVGTGFHPELSGRENVFLNGAVLGMRRAEILKKFDEIVAFAGIEKFIDTPVKYYSSGMYMRLAFAVAAHLEPEILVVDEVLAVGDAAFQKKCIGKMGEVARSGRTVLFVSHQMSMIETLCQRGILLTQGRVGGIGPVRDVVQKYLAETAARLGETDLSRIPRTGSGEFRLERFWVEDGAGQPVPSVASGAPVRFCFAYSASVGPANRVSLGFSIHTPAEQTVALLYSDYQGVSFTNLPPKGVIRFATARLQLSHGSYYIGVRVLVNGAEADWPRDYVGRVDVDAGDYYGAGQAFHSGIGPSLIDGQWSEPAEAADERL
jgi:lipopolysaccharide transport system ATP-binding protein